MIETRPIRFLHRGTIQAVQDLPPTTTVLSWLREHAQACGTKEGCNEGDCGACTVAVGERQADGSVSLRNLNACLMFLPSLDGKALFTVEDLRLMSAGPLHPVQEALVEHHGSQCGFCTPGFVMSIWTTCENLAQAGPAAHQPSRQDWADALAGNLCRCTGYRPILDAAQQAAQRCVKPTVQPGAQAPTPHASGPDWTRLSRQLADLATDAALHYAATDRAFGAGSEAIRCFHAPKSSDELAELLQRWPDSRILGGATDVALWVNKQHRDVGRLVATQFAADLGHVITTPDRLRLGAGVKLEQAWQALARDWPSLMDLWRRFASPPVRHAGTLAGNVANGSPIGDAPPILIALGADLVLRNGSERRTMALDDFYLGYQRNALTAGEFIEWIEVPRPRPGFELSAWKLSKRYDSDISAVCGGMGLHFEGSTLVAARLAFGGMAATVRRAAQAEAALLSKGWSAAGIEAACQALALDFSPMTDLRASAGYRLEGARALLRRLWWSRQSPAPAMEVWR